MSVENPRNNYESNLTKIRQIEVGSVGVDVGSISTTSVSNAIVGPLTSGIRIDKNGNTIAVPDSDWSNYETSQVSYASATRVNTNGFNATETISPGDRIRIQQGGSTKYFFATYITTTFINITAGAEYTFTSDSITEFAVSDKVAPSGFPLKFTYDLLPSAYARFDYTTAEFFIIGPRVFIAFSIFSNAGLISSAYDLNLPVAADVWASSSGSYTPDVTYVGLCDVTPYIVRYTIDGADNDTLIMSGQASKASGVPSLLTEAHFTGDYPLFIG